jgi:NTE family protein
MVSTSVTERARIALVLGGGWKLGGSFHAGVLRALRDVWEIDARDVDTVVGTSSGAITGAFLAAGIGPDDLFAREVGAETSRAAEELFDRARAHAGRRIEVRARLAGGLPSSPAMALRSAARADVAPGAVLAGLMPRGWQGCGALRRYFDSLLEDAWPHRPRLRLCAVDLGTGRRVVLDGASGAAPGEAVAASCAIPGLYAPVRIGGRDYVDGAVHSVNNADVVSADADVVIVSSPLSIDHYLRPRRPLAALRNVAHAQAARECRGLGPGAEVVMFEPSTPVAAAMGSDLNDVGRRSAVARHAYATATDVLSRTALPPALSTVEGGPHPLG